MTSGRKVAVVTAASRGIGAACARELAGRGYALALLARSADVEALAAELGGVAVRGSVADEAGLRAVVEAAEARFGRVDVVVNNTGHAPKGDLADLSDADWLAGFELLFLNVVRMARLVVPGMTHRGGGALVNVSSFAAVEPDLRFPVSAAVRAALGSYAKLFAQRHGAAGVRMNNVLPGWISNHPADPGVVAAIPAGRQGTVEEVAKVVGFLASDDASYVTGQSWLVDGGAVRGV